MPENPYDILGVSPDASPDEVKKAYRKKARENHPDLNPDDPGAAERMNKINEAYDRIMNPEKYAARDRRAGAQRPGGSAGGYGAGGSAQRTGSGYAGGAQRPGSTGYAGGQGYAGGSGPYGWAGGFGFDFDDLFGFGGDGSAAGGPIHPEASATDSPEVRSAINDINAGNYQRAVSTLNTVVSTGRFSPNLSSRAPAIRDITALVTKVPGKYCT